MKANGKSTRTSPIALIALILFISFGLTMGTVLANVEYSSREEKVVDMKVNDVDSSVGDTSNKDLTSNDDNSLKSLDLVDVTDHGAVGDGMTDDYQAIMDSLNYAVNNNKDGVYFPNGTYAISDKLWMNSYYSGMSLISNDAIIKPIDENAERVIEFKADSQGDVEDITIKGLTLDGNVQNLNHDRWGNWGIHVWSDTCTARNIHIEDIETYGFSGNGLYIDSSDTLVKDIYSHDNWGHGLAIGGSASNLTAENITAVRNVSPNNSNYGSGIDLRGGDDIVVNNFLVKDNGFGFKTSVYEPDAVITNGRVVSNNWYGMRIIQDTKNIYLDNITSKENGYCGFVFRDQGTINVGSISSINDGQIDGSIGALYIADDMGTVNIEDLTISNYPSDGIHSYTNPLIIENLDISGCGGVPINAKSSEIELRPPNLQNTYYTINEALEPDSIQVLDVGATINGEKIKAIPNAGTVEIDLDDWTSSDRIFNAYASDTVTFEMENLASFTSYSLYSSGSFTQYASTDSDGNLHFQYDSLSSEYFNVQSNGVNVETQEATDVSSSSAVLHGEITDMDGQSDLEVFFKYRKVGETTWQETTHQSFSSLTGFSSEITSLSSSTDYEFKAVSQWDDGTSSGETTSFINTFTTNLETEPYDWNGFLDPAEGEVIYKSTLPANISTTVDSVPDSDDNGTSLNYWGEFYLNDQFVGEKDLNSEPSTTEYTFNNLDTGTQNLKVEWHYDLGLIEKDEINITIQQAEPDFTLSNLQISPLEMYVGTDITAEVDVENVGTESGSYTADFYHDTTLIGSDTVTLDVGQVKTASIVYNVTDSSTHDISVETLTQTITVYSIPSVISDPATTITQESALLNGKITELGMESSVTAYFRYRKIGDSIWTETTHETINGEVTFSKEITSLSSDTEYEFKAVMEWGTNESSGSTLTFTTEAVTNIAPNIPVNPSPSNGETKVSPSPTLSVDVSDPDGDSMNVTFYDASDDSVIGTSINVANGSKASVVWSGLSNYTSYQWYAVSDDGNLETQSSTWSFTTVRDTPDVITVKSIDVTENSAVLVGEVTDMGDYDEVTVYFKLREINQESWTVSAEKQILTDEGEFQEKWNNLAPSTIYEFKSVIEYGSNFTTGSIKSLGTDILVEPKESTDISFQSAVLNGELLKLGDNSQVEVYFEYRVLGESVWESTESKILYNIGEFEITVNNLEPGTTYEYKPIAKGEATVDGKINTFDTEQAVPSVTDVYPSEGETINGENIEISIKIEHPLNYNITYVSVTLLEQLPSIEAEIIDNTATVNLPFILNDGNYTGEIYIEDETGSYNTTTFTFTVDNSKPYLSVDIQNDMTEEHFTITGETDTDVELFINGEEVKVDQYGHFIFNTTLEIGENTYRVAVEDGMSNRAERVYTVVYTPMLDELEEDIEGLQENIEDNKELLNEINNMTDNGDEELEEINENLSEELNVIEEALEENSTALENALDTSSYNQIEEVHQNLSEIKNNFNELEESIEKVYSSIEKQNKNDHVEDKPLLAGRENTIIVFISVILVSILLLGSMDTIKDRIEKKKNK